MSEPFFTGEVMVLGWGETSTRGRTVTLLLDEEHEVHPFRDLKTKQGKSAGQRMMAVFVLLTDDDRPEEPSLVRDAAVLCRTPSFWHWADEQAFNTIDSESTARDWLCDRLDIGSRSELSTNERAAEKFRFIAASYRTHMQRLALGGHR